MAAVASMKPGGQHAVQQTFPYVFQQDFQAGTAYFPSVTHEPMHLMTGETFQSEYHRQKRNDAVQSVYNGLANDRAKEMKLLTGTANYHLPKPVLGQRIFANPSLGAGSDSSARRDGSVFSPWTIVQNMIPTIQTVADNLVVQEGQLQGGVMKTQDGVDYYTRNLRARIDQLNAMNSIATGVPVPRGSTTRPPLIPTAEGPPDKVEFFLLLSTFEASLTEGNLDRFGFDDLKRLVRALFSFAPVATVEDFENMMPPIENSLNVLQQGMIEIAEDWDNSVYTKGPDYTEVVTLYTQAMFEYISEMFQNINLSVKDKELLSKGLQKEFGFTRLMRMRKYQSVIGAVRGTNERVNQVAEDNDDDDGNGQFNHPAEAREDEDQGNRQRAPFAGEGGDPNREIYGARRAQGARDQSYAYFGAEQADQPIMAQPLASSGEGETVQGDPSYAQYNMAALWAIDSAISKVLPSTSSMKSRLDELDAAVEEGSIRSYDDFAEIVVATATREADVTRDDVIRGLSYFDSDFPDVFSNFIAQNRPEAPVASVASEAPSSSSSSSSSSAPAGEAPASSSSSSSTVTGRGSSPLPLGIKTRNELKALSEAKLREFGRLLPASYGGPYRAREDTKLRDQRLTLIKKIRQVKEDF